MKALLMTAALGAVLAAGAAGAAPLYNNGAVVNGSGLSVLSSPDTTYGFTSSTLNNFAVADNFSVTGAGWNVASLSFFAYQTQSTTSVFTFTSATWSVIKGADINSGTVVASGTTAVTNGGLVGYRVQDTTPTNQQRAIFQIDADVTDFSLASGSYWLTWALTGSASFSGPFVPPVLDSFGSGNAMQGPIGGPFALAVDATSGRTPELPFVINGTANANGGVPEPASWATMIAGFGLIGAAARRRSGRMVQAI